ncbi:MAG: Orange carotenoid protein [Leptolyngbya sp. SIO1D8]|nr:Orange carotenoid protein [Leptolyngbya sp. SIO1D8]
MTYTVSRTFDTRSSTQAAVPNAIAAFNRLTTDDKLGLLWVLYRNMGGAITPAAPGAARLQFAEGLLQQVKAMPQEAQLQFMRDLIRKVNTPETRSYGVLTNNTKLAFWYQLAVLMDEGKVIPVPEHYKMSNTATAVFAQIAKLEFGQQITVMRQAVVNMGIDPLA